MNTSDTTPKPNGDAVEELLRRAPPRPAPPAEVEQEVRAAVRAEWQAVSKRLRRRRMGRNIAVAATVLLAVLVALTSLRQVDVPAVEVAQLEQSFGTLRLQGGDSTDGNLSTFLAGQSLQTGADSGAGLKWQGGGSLRVDEETRIEFVAANEVYLHSGRVYFDSYGAEPGAALAVRTDHGVVTHIGTQFMTAADADRLVVSVREGEIRIAEASYNQAVYRGQRAEFVGGRRPVITNTSGIDAEWAWVEAVAPRISLDGMSAHEFLQWVGRETGYTVEYANAAVDGIAREAQLHGVVDEDPRTELRLRMLTMDLDAEFDTEGARILVTD